MYRSVVGSDINHNYAVKITCTLGYMILLGEL